MAQSILKWPDVWLEFVLFRFELNKNIKVHKQEPSYAK